MRLIGPDHIVLRSADPERLVDWYASTLGLEVLRLEEWRANEVPFVSLRVSETFLIDVMRGYVEARRAWCVASVDLALAAGAPLETGAPPK